MKTCGHCGKRFGSLAGTCVRRLPPNTDHCGARLCYHCHRAQAGKARCKKRKTEMNCPECGHPETSHLYALDAAFTTEQCNECVCPQVGKPSWKPKK